MKNIFYMKTFQTTQANLFLFFWIIKSFIDKNKQTKFNSYKKKKKRTPTVKHFFPYIFVLQNGSLAISIFYQVDAHMYLDKFSFHVIMINRYFTTDTWTH